MAPAPPKLSLVLRGCQVLWGAGGQHAVLPAPTVPRHDPAVGSMPGLKANPERPTESRLPGSLPACLPACPIALPAPQHLPAQPPQGAGDSLRTATSLAPQPPPLCSDPTEGATHPQPCTAGCRVPWRGPPRGQLPGRQVVQGVGTRLLSGPNRWVPLAPSPHTALQPRGLCQCPAVDPPAPTHAIRLHDGSQPTGWIRPLLPHRILHMAAAGTGRGRGGAAARMVLPAELSPEINLPASARGGKQGRNAGKPAPPPHHHHPHRHVPSLGSVTSYPTGWVTPFPPALGSAHLASCCPSVRSTRAPAPQTQLYQPLKGEGKRKG